jgi:hypothetical protein
VRIITLMSFLPLIIYGSSSDCSFIQHIIYIYEYTFDAHFAPKFLLYLIKNNGFCHITDRMNRWSDRQTSEPAASPVHSLLHVFKLCYEEQKTKVLILFFLLRAFLYNEEHDSIETLLITTSSSLPSITRTASDIRNMYILKLHSCRHI